MGCDIHGAIEVYDGRRWLYCARIDSLVERNYYVFGSLFGVRKARSYTPAFPKRGPPDDLSLHLRRETENLDLEDIHEVEKDLEEELGGYCHSVTWASVEELRALDWEETVDWLPKYLVLNEDEEPTGIECPTGSVTRGQIQEFLTLTGTEPENVHEFQPKWGKLHEFLSEHREELDRGETVPGEKHEGWKRYFLRRVQTRREAFPESWKWLLFKFMPFLADRYGEANVRMVVWFDN